MTMMMILLSKFLCLSFFFFFFKETRKARHAKAAKLRLLVSRPLTLFSTTTKHRARARKSNDAKSFVLFLKSFSSNFFSKRKEARFQIFGKNEKNLFLFFLCAHKHKHRGGI